MSEQADELRDKWLLAVKQERGDKAVAHELAIALLAVCIDLGAKDTGEIKVEGIGEILIKLDRPKEGRLGFYGQRWEWQ